MHGTELMTAEKLPAPDAGRTQAGVVAVVIEKGLLMIRVIRRAVFVLMLIPAMGSAQDFDRGFAAAQSGDFATALREWMPLAEQGDADAQFNLGLMYATGRGVPQDDTEAVRWYRMAAEQGYARAQSNLGAMYDTGRGVPQDDTEAVRWYRMAAEQGYARAQSNLGLMYGNGEGVPQDDTEAVRWFRMAAEQGYARAQFNLGLMYGNGEGVPQDYLSAHMWFNISAANGDNGAVRRDQVASKMTPADISQAQRRATACMASNYQDCD